MKFETTEFHCCPAVSLNYGGKTKEIIIISPTQTAYDGHGRRAVPPLPQWPRGGHAAPALAPNEGRRPSPPS